MLKKIIATYQLIVGITGIIQSIMLLMRSFKYFNLQVFFFLLIFIFISLFITICGYFLFFGSTQRIFKLNFFSQLLQSISLGISGLFFKFYFGLSVFIGIEITQQTEFKMGVAFSEFSLSTLFESKTFFLGINIIALILMLWFWENWKKAKEHELGNLPRE